MKKLLLVFLIVDFISIKAQICDTIYPICSNGPSTALDFAPLNNIPSTSCSLSFQNGGVLMIFEIISGGSLDVLFDADLQNSYIDVVIYRVPSGIAPCDALTNTNNIIACGLASNALGCFQFGNSFACGNSIPAPYVNTGDIIVAAIDNTFGDNANVTITIGAPPSAQIDISAYPIVTPEYVCHNSAPIQLNYNPSGGIWSGGQAITSGGVFDPSISGLGHYSVMYSFTNSISCTTVSSGLVNVQDCTNLQNFMSKDEVIMYPNPVKDAMVLIEIPSTQSYHQIVIFDINGRIVYHKNVVNHTTQVDVSNLSDGIYIVRVEGRSDCFLQKLIISK
jgi:hypothetical protein